MKYWAALFAALVLNASANLLIKHGMRQIEAGGGLLSDGVVGAFGKILLSWSLVLGMFCFGANLLCFMFALQRIGISVGYPVMTSVGFLIILLVAGWQFGERLSVWQWAGAGLIVLGVWLVASGAARQMEAQAGVGRGAEVAVERMEGRSG